MVSSRTFILCWAGILATTIVYGVIDIALSDTLWGLVPPATTANWLWSVGFLLLSALVLFLPQLRFLQALEALDEGKRSRWGILISIAVILAAITATITCSHQNLLLGDAYSILDRLVAGVDYSNFSAVNVSLHNLIYSVLPGFSADAERAIWTYKGVSIASGILLVVAMFWLLRSTGTFVLTIAGLATSGVVLVFFGYVERYPLLVLTMFLFGLAGALAFGREKRRTWFAVVMLLAACLMHLGALLCLPAALFLALPKLRSTTWKRLLLCLPLAATALVLILGRSLPVASEALVALTPTPTDSYSLFCSQHISDVVSAILLGCPLLALILLGAKVLPKDELWFHVLGVVPGLVFTSVVDPKLGAIRDWDLLTIGMLPLLVCVVRIVACCAAGSLRRTIALVTILGSLAALHTQPWLALNCDRTSAYEAMKTWIRRDLHYSPSYEQGILNVAYAKLVQGTYEDGPEGVLAQERRLAGDATDALNRYNLAVNYARLGRLAEAEQILIGQWSGFELNPRVVSNVARIFRERGNREELIKLLQEAVQRNPANSVFQPELDALTQGP